MESPKLPHPPGGRYMHTEILKYDADGLKFESHLYFDRDKSGRRPAVLVFPEAFGLGEHAKCRSGRAQGAARG
jgi:dienelactone hydrolase